MVENNIVTPEKEKSKERNTQYQFKNDLLYENKDEIFKIIRKQAQDEKKYIRDILEKKQRKDEKKEPERKIFNDGKKSSYNISKWN